jgi:hypothetical protein
MLYTAVAVDALHGGFSSFPQRADEPEAAARVRQEVSTDTVLSSLLVT